MSDHRTPDWRDAKSYGDTARWTFFRWRWEFYRRRVDLQEVFESVYSWELEAFGRANQPGRGEPGCSVMINAAAKKEFGYHFLPDPTVANHPEELLAVLPEEAPLIDGQVEGDGTSAYDALVDLGLIDPQNPPENAELLRPLCLAPMNPGVRLVGFDIEAPLSSQLAMAEKYLRGLQRWKLGYHPQVKRRHPKKWLGYLRTLDARSSDASWSEIAKIHPNTKQTEQTARDIWDQAAELCFNF